MSVIPWSPRYAIGITQIDEQHEHLFFLLNRLYYDFINGTSGQTLDSLIDELIDYATYHFTSEERIMAEVNYPRSSEHAQRHTQFASRIAEMHRDFLAGKPVYLEILTFLKEWLESHIRRMDNDLGKFMQTAGK